MASLDTDSCKKYNVAARWALRQSGVVRARCEEFEPDELLGTPAETMLDEDGKEIERVAADPFAGLKKLMTALESSVGKTLLDRRGELRGQFYQDMRRTAGESISAYCTRFRTLSSELKREGIDLPQAELGWFLKNRMGLDPIRKQLLETALGGKEEYDQVEAEALRLFRDLHSSDPLHRRPPDRAPLLQRFLSASSSHGGRTSAPSSGSSQASTFKSYRSSGSSQTGNRPFRKPFQPQRQAMVAEGGDEDEPEEEELVPADDDAAASPGSLEEVLQAEAEVLAAELQELEEDGDVDPQLLDELESGVEAAAESLVTMREARGRIQDIKKDRGFGKAGHGKGQQQRRPKVHGNQANSKKTHTYCWDCGETGHWQGDKQCLKPGAGLFRPKGKGSSGAPKQVKVTEALNTEYVVAAAEGEHEVMTCVTGALTLGEALDYAHEANAAQAPTLSLDKRLAGALDSACNRTCSGSVWLAHYLESLEKAPQRIRNLVKSSPENEVFRFGNGGCKTSYVRYRIPMMLGQSLLVVWVSVVDVPSLGLLLGRDFLDAIGAVLSFSRKMLRADLLDGSLVKLQQISAGHFALRLAPHTWTLPGALRWRRVGQDGVVAVQVSPSEWLKRKLAAHAIHPKPEHEHLLTEQGVQAADLANSGLKVKLNESAASSLLAPPAQDMASLPKPSTPTTSSLTRPSAPLLHGSRKSQSCVQQMEEDVSARGKSRGVARSWHALMVAAAAVSTVLAGTIPECGQPRDVAFARGTNGPSKKLPLRWMMKAQEAGAFNMTNFSELAGFRNRQGLKMTFLEDPLLQGMMAARQVKGATSAMRRAALAEASQQAQGAEQQGKQQEAIRTLIGPKGGLPSLKGDLVKLAALMKIKVEEKDTVEDLKGLLRPLVKQFNLQHVKSTSSTNIQVGEAVAPKAKAKSTPAPASSQEVPTGITAQDIHGLLSQQEQRFQGMLSQVMQHVVAMQNNQMGPHPASPGTEHYLLDTPMMQGLTPDQEYEIQMAAAQDLRDEQHMRQFGVLPEDDSEIHVIED